MNSGESDNDDMSLEGSEHSQKSSKRRFLLSKDDYDDSEIDDDDDDDDNNDIEPLEDDDDDDDDDEPGDEDSSQNKALHVENDDEDHNRENDEVEEEVEEEVKENEDTSMELDDKPHTNRKKRAVHEPIPIDHQSVFDSTGDSDEDADEDESEEYLQKFDEELNRNYIYEFHPECLNHNSDEVAMLATVVRDATGNIIDPLHRTLPFLTKYERARVLGQRAKQIEIGAIPFVEVSETIVDGYLIAEIELREKKLPFIIKRPIPGGAFEYWHVRDLENINF